MTREPRDPHDPLPLRLLPNGAKAQQRADNIDRSLGYRTLRRTLNVPGLYTADVDQVEFIFVENEIVPAVMIELTLVDPHEQGGNFGPPNERYLANILARYYGRDQQARIANAFAHKFNTPCALVAHNPDASTFWVHNMAEREGWHTLDRARYTRLLRQFARQARTR